MSGVCPFFSSFSVMSEQSVESYAVRRVVQRYHTTSTCSRSWVHEGISSLCHSQCAALSNRRVQALLQVRHSHEKCGTTHGTRVRPLSFILRPRICVHRKGVRSEERRVGGPGTR